MNSCLVIFEKPLTNRLPLTSSWSNRVIRVILSIAFSALCGCAPKPMISYSGNTPPLILAPTFMTGVADGRGRFREIFCAITKERGREIPDYRSCEEALVRLENEPPPTSAPVDLGVSPSPLRIMIV